MDKVAEDGETILITKRGKVVAKLAPAVESRPQARTARMAEPPARAADHVCDSGVGASIMGDEERAVDDAGVDWAVVEDLRRRHGVHTLILYGSRARHETTIESDVDVAG